MADDINPYHSPTARSAEIPRYPKRWRTVGVAVLIILGSSRLLGSLFIALQTDQPEELRGELTSGEIGAVALNTLGAALWLASAYMCWCGRWWMMRLGFVLGLAAMYGAFRLLSGD
jgi:hypothetical protein